MGGKRGSNVIDTVHVSPHNVESWYALARAICAERPQKAAAARRVCWHTPGSRHWTDTGDWPERRVAPPAATRSPTEPPTDWRFRLRTPVSDKKKSKKKKKLMKYITVLGCPVCYIVLSSPLSWVCTHNSTGRQAAVFYKHWISHTCCLTNTENPTAAKACRQSCQWTLCHCAKRLGRNRSWKKVDSFVLVREHGESPRGQPEPVNCRINMEPSTPLALRPSPREKVAQSQQNCAGCHQLPNFLGVHGAFSCVWWAQHSRLLPSWLPSAEAP